MFSSARNLRHMPNLRFLDMVGQAAVKRIDFRDGAEFKSAISATPSANYAWAFYGKVKVLTGGKCECTSIMIS